MKLRKIISGGQTGADKAGLDAGRELGLETGGTAPEGFQTETGSASVYLKGLGLVDASLTLLQRTRRNIRDSEATVVFGKVESPGTAQTIKTAKSAKKPLLVNPTVTELRKFLEDTEIEVLNVAGNRNTINPSVYSLTYKTLVEAVRGG